MQCAQKNPPSTELGRNPSLLVLVSHVPVPVPVPVPDLGSSASTGIGTLPRSRDRREPRRFFGRAAAARRKRRAWGSAPTALNGGGLRPPRVAPPEIVAEKRMDARPGDIARSKTTGAGFAGSSRCRCLSACADARPLGCGRQPALGAHESTTRTPCQSAVRRAPSSRRRTQQTCHGVALPSVGVLAARRGRQPGSGGHRRAFFGCHRPVRRLTASPVVSPQMRTRF